MKISELKKLLRQNGCVVTRQGSRHEMWKSQKTGQSFPVPRHGTDVPPGTVKSIKESAGIE